eukprot:m.30348 g.30348  ORF g.30348 m.30348 type:complete len:96 (-) comp4696_c0_seq1:976-1263(-)
MAWCVWLCMPILGENSNVCACVCVRRVYRKTHTPQKLERAAQTYGEQGASALHAQHWPRCMETHDDTTGIDASTSLPRLSRSSHCASSPQRPPRI